MLSLHSVCKYSTSGSVRCANLAMITVLQFSIITAVQQRSRSFHLLSPAFIPSLTTLTSQTQVAPVPAECLSVLNTQNTLQAQYLVKCVAAASYLWLFLLLASATLLCHRCHVWSRARSNRRCGGRRKPHICQLNTGFVLFYEQCGCLVGWVPVWAWYTAGWVHPLHLCVCVWVEGGLHCLVVQVGDQDIWHWMTGCISGAALTVILVPSFHQIGLYVCVWLCCHLTWYHLSLQHTCRQLCIHTASAAHTFMHSYASNFK